MAGLGPIVGNSHFCFSWQTLQGCKVGVRAEGLRGNATGHSDCPSKHFYKKRMMTPCAASVITLFTCVSVCLSFSVTVSFSLTFSLTGCTALINHLARWQLNRAWPTHEYFTDLACWDDTVQGQLFVWLTYTAPIARRPLHMVLSISNQLWSSRFFYILCVYFIYKIYFHFDMTSACVPIMLCFSY